MNNMRLLFAVLVSATSFADSREVCDLIDSSIDDDRSTSITENDHYAMVFDYRGVLKAETRIFGNNPEQTRARDKLTVLVAADEEYRREYPDPEWQELTNAIVERADEEFKDEFDLDFDVMGFAEWQSEGDKSGEILDDLEDDFGSMPFDFVIGFTKDRNFTHGGIANRYSKAPKNAAVSVMRDKVGLANAARTVQHELSHNFGLGHDSGSTKCVMNTKYELTNWHSGHKKELKKNKKWYTESSLRSKP